MVARHSEDLQWLRRVPRRFNITVYNKGAPPRPLPRRPRLDLFPLPDVGREAFSYLHHVVSRYDTLSDVTVFAQGKPFDHVPDFHKQLSGIAFQRLPVNDFRWMGFIIDEDDARGSLLFRTWSKNPDGRFLDLDAYCQTLWGEAASERFRFYPGAHFAVTAEQVRKQSPSFYEHALEVSATLPDAGHCFERTWDRVFGVNGIPPPYRALPAPIYFRKTRRRAHLIPAD